MLIEITEVHILGHTYWCLVVFSGVIANYLMINTSPTTILWFHNDALHLVQGKIRI